MLLRFFCFSFFSCTNTCVSPCCCCCWCDSCCRAVPFAALLRRAIAAEDRVCCGFSCLSIASKVALAFRADAALILCVRGPPQASLLLGPGCELQMPSLEASTGPVASRFCCCCCCCCCFSCCCYTPPLGCLREPSKSPSSEGSASVPSSAMIERRDKG